MLGRDAAAGRRLGPGGLLGRPGGDGLRARRAQRHLPQGRELLPGRGQRLRPGVADHPQHERRPAGPDGRVHGPDRASSRRRSWSSAGSSWPSARTCPLSGLLVVVLPIMVRLHRPRHGPRDPAVPGDAGRSSTGSTRSCARRSPACGSSARSSGPGTRSAASTTSNRDLFETSIAGQPAVRDDDPGDDGDPQPVDRRGHVVRRDARRQRRDADRQPDRVPPVPDADPVLGADGRVHVRVRARAPPCRPGGSQEVLDTEPVGPRSRSSRCRCRRRRARRGARSSSATSSSATRAPSSRSSATSRSRPGPGETTAIVGSTGSGKSTLVNLIPRFYDVTGGPCWSTASTSATIDREDLWAPDRVRPAEGVPVQRHRRQQPALRRRRTRPTTSCGTRSRSPRGATSSSEMEGGLEAPITQGGTNVSGGQRQRLAIARALVKQAGDLHLRRQLLGARLQHRRAAARGARVASSAGRRVIIVAQRVGTIMNADRILVMDAGRIVGIGTHTELLETNETYREIVYSQLRGGGRGMSGRPGGDGRARPARRRGPDSGGPAAPARCPAGRPGRPPVRRGSAPG